jgi:hypothetical protein
MEKASNKYTLESNIASISGSGLLIFQKRWKELYLFAGTFSFFYVRTILAVDQDDEYTSGNNICSVCVWGGGIVLLLMSRCLKVHKNENFFSFDFEFCTISMLVMHK